MRGLAVWITDPFYSLCFEMKRVSRSEIEPGVIMSGRVRLDGPRIGYIVIYMA